MALYSKESLESLRHKIDLIEVISPYVKLQRSGASYKGLCPFHEEKSPSFIIQRGDTHYHCFGCGAHGDAIAFLMDHAKMTFVESLEFLAQRFQVPLEKVEEQEKGLSRDRLRAVLEKACSWYRFFLLHTEEGHEALLYLYSRGLTLAFLQNFEVGYAPKAGGVLHRILQEEGISEEEMEQVGLLRRTQSGRCKDFFQERITFPIKDRMGHVIGFSARKYKEETFGGKYINTSETPLFKKSQVLFGLCYSRYRIAKERKVLVVEGQIDALRLIDSGFDFTVAGQGTAFGEGHVKELVQLGIKEAYLALDGDAAGQEAAVKIGDLFQSKGIEVFVIPMPKGLDPDAFLRTYGKEAFADLLSKGADYLSFCYRHLCKGQELPSPSQKNTIVETIAEKIRQWQQPVMVHESLKKLSLIASVPQEAIKAPSVAITAPKTRSSLVKTIVDPDRVLEMDLLRFMFLSEDKTPKVLELIYKNINVSHFKVATCAKIFTLYQELSQTGPLDLLALMTYLDTEEEQKLLQEVLQRKINVQRAEEGAVETVRQILIRCWMQQTEEISLRMRMVPTEEALILSKEFDALKKQVPVVQTA
jgi:DNA primase